MRFRGLTLPRGFHFVTTGLDPVVHAPVVHAEVQLSMDCRIKSGNDEHKIVLAARLRPSPAHDDASKRFAVPRKGRGKRSAERRIQPMSARRHQMLPPECASGPVPPPDPPSLAGGGLGGGSPSGAPPRRLPKRPNASAHRAALHAKERTRALPAPSITLKRSTPRPGRSAGGVDARAARERGYEPRPEEPHPLHQSAVTGDVPRTNGHCAGNINGDECQ